MPSSQPPEATADDSSAGGFAIDSPPPHIPLSADSAALAHVFSPNYAVLDRAFAGDVPTESPQLPQLHSVGRLSDEQQSRLVNYLDEQLLHVARRFVRRCSAVGEGSVESSLMTVDSLIDDLTRLIDLIWYSVSGTSTPFLQEQYLLHIADDLIDYILRLPIDSPDKVFAVLAKLDKIFYKLVVGDVPSGKRMSNTERARLESIAERTRVDVVEKLARYAGHEVALTRVYERVLEELN
ncbi:uncharacterized protein V1518DRAFT_132734 [Limtongia smithiae]|uniref:uncharacterized protein n=1 Tax=Limtongia smithiae TaxID=1125753 RepID=UPI0034D002D8